MNKLQFGAEWHSDGEEQIFDLISEDSDQDSSSSLDEQTSLDHARYDRNNRRNLGIRSPVLIRSTQVPIGYSTNNRSRRFPVPRLDTLTLDRISAMTDRARATQRRNPRGRVERVWDTPYKMSEMSERSEEHCPICLEYFEDFEDIIYPKKCGHEFHEKCLMKVMENHPVGKAPCPMCRTLFFGKSNK